MSDSRRAVERLVLYDVDPVNPYGRELAAVLARDVPSVCLIGSRALSWCPANVELRPWLAAQRFASSAMDVAWRRLTGVMRAIGVLLTRRTVLVVVWSRDFWDSSWLALAAAATGRVVVIDHNPSPQRRHVGLKGWAERSLRRAAAVVVVHDAALSDRAHPAAPMVAAHPAYLEWRQRFLPSSPARASSRVLFLGALRPDKGVGEMPGVIAGLPVGSEVRVAGPGTIPDEWHRAATSREIRIDHVGNGALVDDAALGRVLGEGGLVLAPYIAATQSGSVALAVTCGLPVLGYDVGGLRALLADEALVPAGSTAALADAVVRWQAAPWPTSRLAPEEMSEQCAQAWRAVLARVG